MISTIYAVAIAAILHTCNVSTDEHVRYQQLADLQAQRDAAVEEVCEEYWEPVCYYEPAYCYGGHYVDYAAPSDGLNAWSGVNYHDGRTETYYSSNVLYHYRTPEWTLDSEGFWRDADGYYVVAASDMEQGATFTGSKGECKVYDCGCDDGVTDYYVGW